MRFKFVWNNYQARQIFYIQEMHTPAATFQYKIEILVRPWVNLHYATHRSSYLNLRVLKSLLDCLKDFESPQLITILRENVLAILKMITWLSTVSVKMAELSNTLYMILEKFLIKEVRWQFTLSMWYIT